MKNVDILVLVISTSVMGQIATDIYLPSLPDLVNFMHIDARWLKISISIFLLGYATSQFICGPISDRIGRRPFMLTGVVLFALGCCLAVISTNITTLLIARITQGIGVGCFGVANRAILFDTFKGNLYTQSIAVVSMVMAISPMVAPGIGGLLHNYYGWKSTFIFMLIYALILLIALIILLPETLIERKALVSHRKETSVITVLLNDYLVILTSNRFWIFSCINTMGFAAFIFYLGSAAFLIQNNLNYNPAEYGRVISILAVGYIAGSYSSNYLIESRSKYEIINIGSLIQLFSITLFLILYIINTHLLVLIILPMSFFVFGTGMINPNATVVLVTSFPKKAATAASAMGVSMTLGTSLITSLLFFLSDGSITFLCFGLLVFGLIIRSMVVIEKRYFNLEKKAYEVG